MDNNEKSMQHGIMVSLKLGKIEISGRAATAPEAYNIDPYAIISRHRKCDWGDYSSANREKNYFAVERPSGLDIKGRAFYREAARNARKSLRT
jgi:hypothetical protein